jgi:co-chaperonin GroES (HSP10)
MILASIEIKHHSNQRGNNMSAYEPIKIKKIKPIKAHVIVSEMEFGERIMSNTGIYIPSDNGKTHGIRPRWGKVYAIGPNQKDVRVGQWILIEHGRWTRGVSIEDHTGEIHTIRRVDEKDIMMVSDVKPSDETFRDSLV